MNQEENFLKGRMHESGRYFFCPRCQLSFPHPPHMEFFHRIGYGWCWYCFSYVPIEGGDKRGIVRMNEAGELYTEFYFEEDAEKEKQRQETVRRLCGLKPKQR
jgi:hypothetical protein